MAEKKLICHQCRGPKSEEVLYYCSKEYSCKLKYCQLCLQNRYSPEEELDAKTDSWLCPKSREECDCSVCRKNLGLIPFGLLKIEEQKKFVEMLDCAKKQLAEFHRTFPEATIPVTKIGNIEMNTENVGPALQFLEYCMAFSQALIIEDGKAQRILEEIIQGKDGCNMQLSLLENFQIKLLDIIQTKKRKSRKNSCLSPVENEWVANIENLIDSKSLFNAIPREYFRSCSLYHELDANWKLRILNFLCDLALETTKLGSFMSTTSANKEPKEAKHEFKKLLHASQKAINLWNNLKQEEAKDDESPEDGSILTFEEEEAYEKRLIHLKEEFRDEYLKLLDDLKDRNSEMTGQQKDTREMKLIILYTSGKRCFEVDGNFIVQDVSNREDPTYCSNNIDKWYSFTKEDERVVRGHLSSIRKWEEILSNVLRNVPTKLWRKHSACIEEQEGPDDHKDESETDDIDSLANEEEVQARLQDGEPPANDILNVEDYDVYDMELNEDYMEEDMGKDLNW